MLLSLATVSAGLLALPAFASALPAHISATTELSVSGGTGELKTTSGLSIHCSSLSNLGGAFTTTTTGTVRLAFHGCTDKTFGLHCQTTGQPTGTITLGAVAAPLEFHLIMVEHPAGAAKRPGILITPNSAAKTETTVGVARKLFAEFVCFGVTTKVIGNGIIGTITHPACGASSTTMGLAFQQSSNGVQTHQIYTGANYDLESSFGGGAHVTSSIVSSATITFPAARALTCT